MSPGATASKAASTAVEGQTSTVSVGGVLTNTEPVATGLSGALRYRFHMPDGVCYFGEV